MALWVCINQLPHRILNYYHIELQNVSLSHFRFIVIASYTANLAAFLTVSRLETPMENLDDLAKQFKILYAPIKGSEAMMYFERMSEIEGRFYEIWKDMSLNDSLSPLERSKLAVWDYPVSDKYTKIWQAMQEAGLPKNLDEAVERIRNSTNSNGFALGEYNDFHLFHIQTKNTHNRIRFSW